MGKLKGLIIKTTPLGSFLMVGRIANQVKENGGFSGLVQLLRLSNVSFTSESMALTSRLCSFKSGQ